MSIDLFRSRRGYNEFCRWWAVSDSLVDLDELVHKQAPAGTFSAKEINAETYQNAVLGGVFIVDKTTTVIQSPDNLDGIKNNDVVEFQGEIWMIVNVQKKKFRIQNTEFATDKNSSHIWFLELRK